MLSYNNDPKIKQKYIDRMQAHMDSDELVRGTGFENGRGCFIRCTLNTYDHELFGEQIAPEWLAHLADKLHENTSENVWPNLGIRILNAIPVGKKIDGLEVKIKIFILQQSKSTVENLEHLDGEIKTQVLSAIDQCISFHQADFDGNKFESARSAAWSAARSAAFDAQAEYFIKILKEAGK